MEGEQASMKTDAGSSAAVPGVVRALTGAMPRVAPRLGATLAMLLGAGAVALAITSCFSERGEVAAPPEGSLEAECGFPVRVPDVNGPHVIVAIDGFAFLADSLVVEEGTTVTWINCEDPFANGPSAADHTVTSDEGARPLDSPTLAPGESYSFTFTETGEFPYHCTPHPFMEGIVVVEASTT